MKYDTVKNLGDMKFKRLIGVNKSIFKKMFQIVEMAHKKKKSRVGRPNKLSVEDMVLMTLEYYREYRTYFHIGVSYGVSESSAYKTVKFVEESLTNSRIFSLPGKKRFLKKENFELMFLIDATEVEIQRPEKNKENIIQEKEKTYYKSSSGSRLFE